MQNHLRLPLNFDAAGLRSDLAHITADQWLSHYEQDDYVGEWGVVALRSVGGRAENIRPFPGAQILFQDTEVLGKCPNLARAIAAFQCPVAAARLLKLGPGGRILEHKDDFLAPEFGEVRLHVPVLTNPGVEFYLDNERVPLQAGETWYLNFSLPHRIDNLGPTDRVHLVIDCNVNDWLSSLLSA
ncbi:MAG: aspartyl/asparaginyl beta-hydroxylase domain-containing protein [Pyrinomonadaceae bacterium]